MPRFSRRTFLGLGLAGTAALALGTLGVGLQPSVLREPAAPLRVLSRQEFSVLAAVADRICPAGGPFPPASRVGVAEAVDNLLATLHPGTVGEIRQALLVLENALGVLALEGRPVTFTSLPPEAQDRVLERWRTSSWSVQRKVYKALRGLVAAAYYADPAVHAAVGYPGPPDFRGLLAARPAGEADDAEEVTP